MSTYEKVHDVKARMVEGSTTNLTMQPKYGVVCPPGEVQPAYGVPVIQPKYGVTCPPGEVQPAYGVPVIQPKYGVTCPTGELQPAYGVPVIQPKYGVTCGGQDLNITFSQLEENIATLKKAISSLRNSWDVETKKNINTLNGSWVGADCAEYTNKLSNMDKKVQNTISALELLCSTYEQARDMVKESQANAISSIRGIGD